MQVTVRDQMFNSQKWSTWNFSPWYSYITQQTGNENIQTYHLELVILISCQILMTKLQGNVKQEEGRINNQILGVKELSQANHNQP